MGTAPDIFSHLPVAVVGDHRRDRLLVDAEVVVVEPSHIRYDPAAPHVQHRVAKGGIGCIEKSVAIRNPQKCDGPAFPACAGGSSTVSVRFPAGKPRLSLKSARAKA